MTSRDFCYWLQGFFELNAQTTTSPPQLNAAATDCVMRHLALVFKHEIDPSAGPPEHQKVLDQIHQASAAEPNNPLHRPPQIGGDGPGGTKYRC